jgi:hypothetical protein
LSKRFLFSLQGSQFLADFGEPVGRPALPLTAPSRDAQLRLSPPRFIIDLQLLPPKSLGYRYSSQGGTVQIKKGTELNLFVRHRTSGRLVFNPKAIEALGVSPAELAERGYPLDSDDGRPPIETTRLR